MTRATYDRVSWIFNDQEKSFQYAIGKKIVEEKKECCNTMMIKYDDEKNKVYKMWRC